MTSLLNPVTGMPLVDVAKAMAVAERDGPAGRRSRHPLANKVGWFDLNNINCGLLGMPLGFLVIYRGQPDGQGAVEGDAGLRRRDPQAARPDGPRGKDDLDRARPVVRSGVLRGPASFCGPCRCAAIPVSAAQGFEPCGSMAVGASDPILTYWYFHLPNFVLAALMYTLLGRVAARAVRRSRIRRTTSGAFSAGSPIRSWPSSRRRRRRRRRRSCSGCSGSCGCSGCGSCCSICSWCSAPCPRDQAEPAMDRNFYYIGIAFFGMINGLFNSTLLLFALSTCQILAPAPLFGSEPLTLCSPP